MKTILFFRHAKAEPPEFVFSDRERRLSKAGKEQALLVAGKIKDAGIKIDLVLSSPALRAIETAEIAVVEWFGSNSRVQIAETLYEHSDDVVINAIRQLPDDVNCICLFGHNPGFETISMKLAPASTINLPTAGVAHLTFEVSSWSSIIPGTGHLHQIYTPADKVKYLPEFAPAKSRAEKALLKSVQLFTKPLGEKSMSKIEKLVRSMSDKFIKQVLKAVKDAEKQAAAEAKAAAKAGKAAPKKRGRKPAAKSAAKAAATPAAAPKKRGRKPAAKSAAKAAATPAAAPKKRGRKPAAAKAAAPAAAPKKRGRKPAAAKATAPAAAPKKRGRKPAAKPAAKVATPAAPKKRGPKAGAKRGRKPKSAPVPVVVTPDTNTASSGATE